MWIRLSAPSPEIVRRTSPAWHRGHLISGTYDLQLMDEFGFARRLVVGDGKLMIYEGSPS